ncbi:MarR family winged helix-turn-helix transcriptional regulator [Glutamicibacter protophormiae]|uniref:MarR family winged helix-turn-helix transcriptional regulator n=1 Tax=Glutamicibacter protophormiae TaxID=37930 RepID=UPI002A8177F3|nr:MarR family winged helix-turn-helix transcriptional regulator [Glutamicibacter protophormiae]WPR64421.1 MarR family winged helix-turn-helix transcriptional regulator [Glutamicibacter protophormiae]WPR67915.1 MarR family winged helix-turn-helix transcriptional regulator [Glutamicibacter protophormiae]
MSSYRASGYWYDKGTSVPGAVDLLNLMRRFREAERKMRAQTRNSMGMNETDMSALRFLLAEHRKGVIPRQRDFAEELGISHASISVLIDRLCRDGYAERIVHPSDRRSVGIIPTQYSDTEVRGTLHEMHERMMDAVNMLAEDERIAAAKFLEAMIRSVEIDDRPIEPPAPNGTQSSALAEGAIPSIQPDNA